MQLALLRFMFSFSRILGVRFCLCVCVCTKRTWVRVQGMRGFKLSWFRAGSWIVSVTSLGSGRIRL